MLYYEALKKAFSSTKYPLFPLVSRPCMLEETEENSINTIIEVFSEVMKSQDAICMSGKQPSDMSQALKRRLDEQLRTKDPKRFRAAAQEGTSFLQTFCRIGHGYLMAGNAHFELGHYARAIEIYQLGLKETSDPDLEYALQRAIARRDIKLDPVDKLNSSILRRVLDTVPEQRLVCARLSHRWRDLLLRLSVWNNLHIYLRKFRHPLWQDGLTQVLKRDLKNIYIQGDIHFCTVLSLLTEAQCHSIEKLRKSWDDTC